MQGSGVCPPPTPSQAASGSSVIEETRGAPWDEGVANWPRAKGPVPALPFLPKAKVTPFPHGSSEGLAREQWFLTGRVPDNIVTHLGQNK